MTVLFLINNLAIGGAERVLQLLANEFQRCGHRVVIFTLEAGPVAYSLDPDIEVHQLSTAARSPAWRNLLMPVQAVELGLRLRTLRPDIVLSFMLRPNFVHTLASFGHRSRKHWVSEHCRLEMEFPSTTMKGSCLRWLVGSLYPRAAGSIAVSEDVKASMVAWGVPFEQITVIPNPIHMAEIERLAGPADATPRRLRIVNMGRLVAGKDQRLLLEAAAPLLEKWDAELVIIGDGPLRTELASLVQVLGLEQRVRLLGSLANPFPVLRQSDIFALCSKSEGFGLALLEAMACRLPVVSSESGSGPEDILEAGQHGILVKSGDIAELRQALELLLRDSELRIDLAERAYRRARDFDIAPIALRYRQLFGLLGS